MLNESEVWISGCYVSSSSPSYYLLSSLMWNRSSWVRLGWDAVSKFEQRDITFIN